MWEDRDPLDSLLWEAALDDLGIYPRAIVKNGVETLRTDWQDGWNAAVMALTERRGRFLAWVRSLSDEQRGQLQELLDADGEPISLHYRDNEVRLFLACGDTFCYACADLEPFDLADLPTIHRLWKAHGYYGTVAWIATKRGAEPVKEYRYDPGYLAAKANV